MDLTHFIKEKRPSLSASSVKTYNSILTSLYKKIYPMHKIKSRDSCLTDNVQLNRLKFLFNRFNDLNKYFYIRNPIYQSFFFVNQQQFISNKKRKMIALELKSAL